MRDENGDLGLGEKQLSAFAPRRHIPSRSEGRQFPEVIAGHVH
jgi:hypothetical protein